MISETRTAMAIPDIPEELLIEIFSRLPAKSIGKCRCLSKSWKAHLYTQKFIKFHLYRRTQQEENLILIDQAHSLHLINSPTKDNAVSTKVALPKTRIDVIDLITAIQNDTVSEQVESRDFWSRVVGSCNGLLLLINEEDEIFLSNPITLEQISIPPSPLLWRKEDTYRMHGFGYDESSDDYKILLLYYYDNSDEENPDFWQSFVHVYSVKERFWNRFKVSPYDHSVPLIQSGVFVNGAVHWLASNGDPPDDRSVITAFDLAKEAFVEIPAPAILDPRKFVFNRLSILGGCLCMVVDNPIDSRIDFWIMKEYGLRESWIRYSMCDCDWMVDEFKTLCFIGNEKVLSVSDEGLLVVQNLNDGTTKDMIVNDDAASFIGGYTFVDSLVSPGLPGFSLI